MREWISPTIAAVFLWGFWGFLPKLTIRYLEPSSAIVFEVVGGIILGTIILAGLQFRPQIHAIGILLAMMTGLLGAGGAFCFLRAVQRGPVTLVATLSALYPAVTILLAYFFLHEAITVRQAVGIGLALLSVILVAA
ncbi:EamA family transporter [Leptolyngbya ohadii]|uniref:EamA family transporter n=1 Tax=Leptolyngbya ohadii TaxID=1962290 RepID=UPI000B5993E9|nr:EamA family transporter [Leptolyngbya ohadii]